MPFFDKFKESASRVAAEADRALRMNRIEGGIKQRRDQRQDQLLRLGELTAQLHQSGRLTTPELQPLAQIVLDLDKQIADLEREGQAIRAEGSEQRPIQPYGHLCSRERTMLPPMAAFCPNCGAAAIDVEAPAVTPMRTCERCGRTGYVAGNFCPECGAPLPVLNSQPDAPQPAPPPPADAERDPVLAARATQGPVATVCSKCATALAVQAVFCPNCGTRR